MIRRKYILVVLTAMLLTACNDSRQVFSDNDGQTDSFIEDLYGLNTSTDDVARYYSTKIRHSIDVFVENYINSDLDLEKLPPAFIGMIGSPSNDPRAQVKEIYFSLVDNFILDCRKKLPNNKSSNRTGNTRFDFTEFGELTAEEQADVAEIADKYKDSLRFHLGLEIYNEIINIQQEQMTYFNDYEERYRTHKSIILVAPF